MKNNYEENVLMKHPVLFVKMGQRLRLHLFLKCIMISVDTKKCLLWISTNLFGRLARLAICTVYSILCILE